MENSEGNFLLAGQKYVLFHQAVDPPAAQSTLHGAPLQSDQQVCLDCQDQHSCVDEDSQETPIAYMCMINDGTEF